MSTSIDIASLGIGSVAGITVICYLLGLLIKTSPIDNKWIPVIVGIFGGILGGIALAYRMPDFPASDIITAIAVGITSGLTATGIDQIFKQMKP